MNVETDIAWAAGFLDGEGCFALTKCSGKGCHETTRNIIIHAAQINTLPLEKLAELFGGTVKVMRTTSAGNVCYQWSITGKEKVQPALEKLIPHLVLKKREAQALLDYSKTIGTRGSKKGQWGKSGSSILMAARRRAIINSHISARGDR